MLIPRKLCYSRVDVQTKKSTHFSLNLFPLGIHILIQAFIGCLLCHLPQSVVVSVSDKLSSQGRMKEKVEIVNRDHSSCIPGIWEVQGLFSDQMQVCLFLRRCHCQSSLVCRHLFPPLMLQYHVSPQKQSHHHCCPHFLKLLPWLYWYQTLHWPD